VRSVAATCLIPITKHLVERLPDEVGRVLEVLWDCLKDIKDDLSSSVGFVMDLLGNELSFIFEECFHPTLLLREVAVV
jgi:TATA-binding protein-associated factor